MKTKTNKVSKKEWRELDKHFGDVANEVIDDFKKQNPKIYKKILEKRKKKK